MPSKTRKKIPEKKVEAWAQPTEPFANQIEPNKKDSEPSNSNVTTLKVGGAVASVGLAAVAGQAAWDAALKTKIMRTPLIEMKAGKGFANYVWNHYATVFNDRQRITNKYDEAAILDELNILLPDSEIKALDPIGGMRYFLKYVPSTISKAWNYVIDRIETNSKMQAYLYSPEVIQFSKGANTEKLLDTLFSTIKSKFFRLLAVYSMPDLLRLVKTQTGDDYTAQAALIVWFMETPPNIAPLIENFGRTLSDTDRKVPELVQSIMKVVPKLVIDNWLYNCPLYTPGSNTILIAKSKSFKETGSIWATELIAKLSAVMGQDELYQKFSKDIATIIQAVQRSLQSESEKKDLYQAIKVVGYIRTNIVKKIQGNAQNQLTEIYKATSKYADDKKSQPFADIMNKLIHEDYSTLLIQSIKTQKAADLIKKNIINK